MASCLVGVYLPLDVTRRVLQTTTKQETMELIQEVYVREGSNKLSPDAKHIFPANPFLQKVVLELASNAIVIARELGLGTEATSSLAGILLQTHRHAVDECMSQAQAYGYFHHLLKQHSMHRPPYCAAIFTSHQTELIDRFLLQTYWRHYRMYYYLFTEPKQATITFTHARQLNEAPRSAPPLSSAMTLAEYELKKHTMEQERKRQMEHEREEAERRRAEEEEQERIRRGEGSDESDTPRLLAAQIDAIKSLLEHRTASSHSQIEERLMGLEEKIAEFTKAIAAQKKRK